VNNQKLENLLNLALDADENERERSEILDVGYDPIEKEWELIVKYSGDIDMIRPLVVDMTVLLNEYMIVTVRESVIDQLSAIPQVEYIEKPKRLYFQIANGKRVSCIDSVQGSRFGLSGKGVLIGMIDSGIDYSLDAFLKADGSTRIRYLWDQTNGKEYISEEINQALSAGNLAERYRIVPSVDSSGHGTAVAGIAAEVASESELIVVKMGLPRQEGFPRTTELMEGIDYLVRQAVQMGKPIAINISFGNNYGSHEPYN
jgi:subtilisin family serine protease